MSRSGQVCDHVLLNTLLRPMRGPMTAPGRLNTVSIRVALSAALAVCLFFIGSAHAGGAIGSGLTTITGLGGAITSHSGKSTTRAHLKYESETKAESEEAPKRPLQIIISIADQRISIYDDGTLIARSSVSTGVQGHPTPIGVFSVIGKQRWHRSNIYSAAPMPYMQRITWSGIALHAGVLPGHPASHGCIRLANDFAIRLCGISRSVHAGYHRARRCLSGPDSEPAPFFKAENRVQFTVLFG